MNSYIQLMRPSVCVLSSLGMLIGIIIASSFLTIPLLPAILAIIVAFIITGAGNVINDIFDIDIDKVNAPHRPLPSGDISKDVAMKFFLLLVAAGLILSFIVNLSFLLIAVINVIVLYVYSWKLKVMPLIGNIAVSWLASSTFIAAGFILSFSAPLAILILAFISFFATFSREIIKDIEDVRGDMKKRARTLPIVAGFRVSKILASAFMAIAVLSLSLPFMLSIFSLTYLIGAVPAAVLALYALFNPPEKSQKYVKIAMYLVFLGFLLGSFITF